VNFEQKDHRKPANTQSARADSKSCEGWVVASIPYFRCSQFIRKSVMSLLNQSYSKIVVVVLNDGDPNAPWNQLEDIRDPRLVRFDLASNRGRYFADEVTLRATPTGLFLMQDADDWSHPSRVANLLTLLETSKAGAAVSAVEEYTCENGEVRALGKRPFRDTMEPPSRRFSCATPHVWLARTSALRRIGGYFGNSRVAFDTLLVKLMILTSTIAYTDESLYCRLIRPNSLCRSPATGLFSRGRRMAAARFRRLYQHAYALYVRKAAGQISFEQMCSGIRELVGSLTPPHLRLQIEREASSLEPRITEALQRSLVVPPPPMERCEAGALDTNAA
jgi:glycosyltransferase involved in cell wall biosynthesis